MLDVNSQELYKGFILLRERMGLALPSLPTALYIELGQPIQDDIEA
jgi:hypothetical protein